MQWFRILLQAFRDPDRRPTAAETFVGGVGVGAWAFVYMIIRAHLLLLTMPTPLGGSWASTSVIYVPPAPRLVTRKPVTYGSRVNDPLDRVYVELYPARTYRD